MSANDMRAEVHQMIDELDDSFLRIVHSMLGTHAEENEYPVVGYDLYGNPKRANELMEEYEQELAAAERGEAIAADVFAKRTKEWLSSIK